MEIRSPRFRVVPLMVQFFNSFTRRFYNWQYRPFLSLQLQLPHGMWPLPCVTSHPPWRWDIIGTVSVLLDKFSSGKSFTILSQSSIVNIEFRIMPLIPTPPISSLLGLWTKVEYCFCFWPFDLEFEMYKSLGSGDEGKFYFLMHKAWVSLNYELTQQGIIDIRRIQRILLSGNILYADVQ